MFLASFPAGPWQANCYLAAAEAGAECVIVDPGVDASEGVRSLVAEHDLTPAGILLTHGHIDHVATAAALAREYGVPCWIHPEDRLLLTDPAAGLSSDSRTLLAQLFGDERFEEPPDLRMLDERGFELGGLEFSVVHAPGHRPGCVMFGVAYGGHPEIDRVMFTGDVVFAGSIGRTDLPGGDSDVMRETLITKVLALPDTAALLPGHGPQTVMARERATNPYLHTDFLRS
ncbi:MAG: MBL fold metallo-hydrolase [Micropruina sp.]